MTSTYKYLIVAAVAVAAMAGIAIFEPRLAAGGWLLALTYIGAFPIGSLALLMIHRLTGGRWGEVLEPVLLPLSRTTPLLLLLVIPVLFASPVLFSWTHNPGGEITHSVRLLYLNVPAYIVRSLIALAGLSLLAFILPAVDAPSAPLIAGAGLVFYGVAVTFLGLDWQLTPEAPFFSTSFGASVAFTQLLATLAFAAVFGQRSRAFPDLGALMLVVTLAITYTDFMALLVMWYGDVPSKVFWFVERIREPWLALAVAAFIITSLIPISLLMFARLRASRAALRLIGACNLIGLALYQSWLLAPAFGAWIIATALLALLSMTAFAAAAIAGGWMEKAASRWRAAHG
jgi:hypothetical protein